MKDKNSVWFCIVTTYILAWALAIILAIFVKQNQRTISALQTEQVYQRDRAARSEATLRKEVKQLRRIIWVISDKEDIMLQIELGCIKCHSEYIEEE